MHIPLELKELVHNHTAGCFILVVISVASDIGVHRLCQYKNEVRESTEHNASIIADSLRKIHHFVAETHELNQVIVMATSRSLTTSTDSATDETTFQQSALCSDHYRRQVS